MTPMAIDIKVISSLESGCNSSVSLEEGFLTTRDYWGLLRGRQRNGVGDLGFGDEFGLAT